MSFEITKAMTGTGADSTSLWESCNVNYGELRNAMSVRTLGSPPTPAERQRLANLSTALNAFVSYLAKQDEDRIGRELGHTFRHTLARFSEHLLDRGATKTKTRDYRSLMCRWHELFVTLCSEADASAGGVTPFHALLRRAFDKRGVSDYAVAKDIGISRSTLQHWLAGVMPNRRSTAALHRLEAVLGVPTDGLVRLRGHHGESQVAAPPVLRIAFRLRQSVRTREPYYLKEGDVPSELRSEWLKFLAYKTSPTVLRRQERGTWRLRPLSDVPADYSGWAARARPDKVAPSAALHWNIVRAYLGYLRLSTDRGGFGLDASEGLNLAAFARPEWVLAYCAFLQSRADDRFHGGIRMFTTFVSSLLHSVTGYLTQQPRFASQLGCSESDWSLHCANALAHVKQLVKQGRRHAQPSRDPFEPLRPLLSLSSPLAPVIAGIRAYERYSQTLPRDSEGRAMASRNLLALKLLIANPLRLNNFVQMRYLPDNSGNLYRSDDGSWRLRFQASDFKNIDGAARGQPYDVPVDPSAWDAIEEWLFVYKPLVDHGCHPFVFCSTVRSQQGVPWSKLGSTLRAISKRWIPQCPGLGPHAFRHLVATAYLKQCPGEYPHVAKLLHDRLETVLKNYAHLSIEDGVSRWGGILQKLLNSTASRH